MSDLFDVFISYGRADSKDFAIKLHQNLTEIGLNVWFDKNDIPLAVDYQAQIDRGIEQAHNFVFIISPHSVNSAYCLKEIKLAIELNKQIIPIMHVEQIDYDIWQSRNTELTEENWQEYRAKELHSSFGNMHLEISKINWIYCREDIDDFAASFAELIQIIEQNKSYLEKHTRFLVKALDWSRNQKQTNYLLIGSERREAEAWLKYKFSDRLPPCLPTDLHCEFISESIKNANNLMTQVFLSAAEEDVAIKSEIGLSLMREALTVWTNQTDIRTGTAFQTEINKGIEGADTFVYLISLNTLRSAYCQQEIEYAFAHNKYIIPLLIEEIDFKLIPTQLLELQFIDLTGSPAKYNDGIDKLIKAIKSDASYYEMHKLLLVKALKWQRQNCNSSILLRGYNLEHFADWLKVAQHRQDNPPLPLQSKFISESHKQPIADSLEVFVSYSRANSDFARQLNDALTEVGKLTWFDQESIASGADFKQEIYRGIENCDNFVFIISPPAIASPYCTDEIEYALKLHKRIIPVVYRAVSPQDLHPVLAKTQWIDFNQGGFDGNFPKLVRTIDTDREHVRSHTKWSQRSREWLQREKDEDLLLRGSEFVLAQNWLELTQKEDKQPTATSLQQEFIASSEKRIIAEEEAEQAQQARILRLQQERTEEAEARLVESQKYARRQKLNAGIATIGFAITTVLGLAALGQYYQAKIAEAKAMSLSSEALFASGNKLDALIKAIKAKRQLEKIPDFIEKIPNIADDESPNKVTKALQQAVYTIRESNVFSEHYGAVLGVAFSPKGELIASGSSDNTVILRQKNGSQPKILEGHEGSVNTVTFSLKGKLIATASADNTIKLWQEDGTLLKSFESEEFNQVAFSPDEKTLALANRNGKIEIWLWDGKQATLATTFKTESSGLLNSLAFSPNGELIAAGSNNAIKIWKRDGTLIQTLKGHRSRVLDVAFSDRLIASASADGTVKLWQQDGDGTPIETLRGHRGSVRDVAFSPDGQRVISGSHDNTIKLWQLDGTLLHTFEGHRDQVMAVDFSPDGESIVSGSEDNSVRLWQLDNKLLTPLLGHQNIVREVAFSPNGSFVATASEDGTIKLWQPNGEGEKPQLLNTLSHGGRVLAIDISPDSQLIVSGSADGTIKLWQPDGELINTLKGHSDRVLGVAFSPDGIIASASADDTIKLWQPDGELINTLEGLEGHKEEVNAVDFSPDGQLIASGSGDNTVKLWQRDGKLVNTLKGHKSTVFSVDISPDGRFIASGSGDNTVKLWNIKGEFLVTLKDHSDSVMGVKFAPDSQTIASASVDQTIKLWRWDGDQAKLETTSIGHSNAVESIDFSPKGETLASGSEDRTAILWNRKESNILNFNSKQLLKNGCEWVEDYLKYNQESEESDQKLEDKEHKICDDI